MKLYKECEFCEVTSSSFQLKDL